MLDNNYSETYSHTDNCTNCGKLVVHQIPKGVTIAQYLLHKQCPNCGVSKSKTGGML